MFDQEEWERVKPELWRYVLRTCGAWSELVDFDNLMLKVEAAVDAGYHPIKGELLEFCKRAALRHIISCYGVQALARPLTEEIIGPQHPAQDLGEQKQPTIDEVCIAEGVSLDVRRRLTKVMLLRRRGEKIKVIARSVERHSSTVNRDIRWLKDHGFL